jgi:hypothetical protein
VFLKRFRLRSKDRDPEVNDKVPLAQREAIAKWSERREHSYDYLKAIKQPTLVVNGSTDPIIYTVNSFYSPTEPAKREAHYLSRFSARRTSSISGNVCSRRVGLSFRLRSLGLSANRLIWKRFRRGLKVSLGGTGYRLTEPVDVVVHGFISTRPVGSPRAIMCCAVSY